jgi:hypothetical protein
MFGHRFFGAAYFGPRFFGGAGSITPPAPSDLAVFFGGGFFPKRRRREVQPEEALQVIEAKGTDTQREHAARIEAERLFERLAERDLDAAMARRARAERAWAQEVALTILRERDDEELALYALLLDD